MIFPGVVHLVCDKWRHIGNKAVLSGLVAAFKGLQRKEEKKTTRICGNKRKLNWREEYKLQDV